MDKLKYIQVFILAALTFHCNNDDVVLKPIFNLAQESPIDEDDYLIYSQIINDHYSYDDKPIAIVQGTLYEIADVTYYRTFAGDYQYFDSTIVENLISINDTTYNLGYNFKSATEVRLITNSELEYIDEKDQWFNFKSDYIDMLKFSRVGYNRAKTQAVVVFSSFYSGHIVWFIKIDGKWKEDKFILTWIK